MEDITTNLIFFVNGRKIIENNPDPEWTLLYYLRNKLLLCGTKLGCGEGGCGACTVMVSKYDRKQKKIIHLAINACLAPICSMHGFAVTTVEGIGSTKTKLHPVQERIAKAHGSQCGFCTPGIVMSMYTLLRNAPKPSLTELQTTFQGNLCRCTGYRPIIEGYKTFCEDWAVMVNGNKTCGLGNKCCKLQNGDDEFKENELFDKSDFVLYDPSQEPIFPPELKFFDILDRQNLKFKGKSVTWYRPITLTFLLLLKNKHPKAKIVVGNTEIRIETKYKHFEYPVQIQPTQIPELTDITVVKQGITIGAAVTLQNMEIALREQIKIQPEYKTRIFSAIIDMLQLFAGKQVRNVAAVGGNIMTGSPISDLNPILISAKTELKLASKTGGERKIMLDENFFTSYRKNVVHEGEILVAFTIPFTKQNQYFYAYKQSRRRDDDTAIVNCALNISLNKDIVTDFKFSFGGMASIIVCAFKTSKFIIGQPWNKNTFDTALQYLLEDLPLSSNAPGGMIEYRKSLTLSLFFRAFLKISDQLHQSLDAQEISAIKHFKNQPPKSSQYFQVLENREKGDVVGLPLAHISAFKHATGEAVYCDDAPKFVNELYMAFVLSTKAHANISIDASEALKMEGVRAFFSAKDIPSNRNQINENTDEYVFIEKTVTAQGQILGAVVADDQIIAQNAARKVKVIYEELKPVIISLEDAIKHKSFFTEFANPIKVEIGDVDQTFKTAPHVLQGDSRTGCQEHFYMETQSVVAVPKEGNEMEIFCSTQVLSEVTKKVAHLLDVPESHIITKAKRIGGGFGGKEVSVLYIALPVALAASRLGCPIRCMLDRDEDILITGGRHPFFIKYKVAFDDDGKLLGYEAILYSNGGYSGTASNFVMQRAMLHTENAYKIPNVRVIGYVCKTNIPSNTSFRGFGAPQAMLAAEFMIRKVAEYLGKDVFSIAQLNFYKNGDTTFYNQTLEHLTIDMCWEECTSSANFLARRKEVEEFNRKNRWKKRGISMVPTKYGVGVMHIISYQAGALIHVYTDGSVLLTHGGIEMGQGLHTKMIQVASRVLEILPNKIHTSEVSTDKVPNTTPTVASISSDLNGMAVLNACEIIKKRLEPYKKANPKGKWEDWVLAAYLDRVSLSTTAFYKCPCVEYNFETNTGEPYRYYTVSAACSEVEIDCLTGDHQVLRTDIVMDVGQSLNPAIDVGQIEGAFMQGYGLYMLEEMLYSPDGAILTKGPGTYKLPGFGNIPAEFNVSLLKGSSNLKAIYSSKAIGEPPLFSASSVLFAVREAIKSSREDAGFSSTDFDLYAPVTCAKIRMACEDHLTSKLNQAKSEASIPWNIVP